LINRVAVEKPPLLKNGLREGIENVHQNRERRLKRILAR
jgi:hypothetical protein